MNEHLRRSGIKISNGTIVDATIISAPSSTKNQSHVRGRILICDDAFESVSAEISAETRVRARPEINPGSIALFLTSSSELP
jgi:hypothetical protein